MTTTITGDDRDFVISKVINAPRERVFKAWTDAKQMSQWFAPAPLTVPYCELDARPGGKWSLTMRMPNGEEYPIEGIYKEVVEPERIVYTNDLDKHPEAWHERLRNFGATDTRDSVNTVTFEDQGDGKTLLTVRSTFDSVETRNAFIKMQMREGWTQGLIQLATLVSGTSPGTIPVIVERVLDAPVAVVWQALTAGEQLTQWYFDLPDFKAEVGYEFHFTGGPPEKQYLHLCRVTEVVPDKRLSHTWRYDGYPGDSLVTFELLAEGDKTRLRLVHSGIETFPQNDPAFAKSNFAEGWAAIIGGSLKAFVEAEALVEN